MSATEPQQRALFHCFASIVAVLCLHCEAGFAQQSGDAAQVCQRLDVVFHGRSYHFNRHQRDWVEWNNGIGMRCALDQDFGLGGGLYRNSYGKTSQYATVEYLPTRVSSTLRAGGFIGITNHYPWRNGQVVPAGGLALRWEAERWHGMLRIVPKLPEKTSGLIELDLGLRWQ